MNRALTVMTVITAVLLLVSGVIVAGSMEQSRQIGSQRAQLTELRQKLNAANKQLTEQSGSSELLMASLEAVRKERDEALTALGEANDAAAESSQALNDSSAEYETALSEISTRYEQSTASAADAGVQLQTALSERDGFALRVSELESELETVRGELSAANTAAEEQTERADAVSADYDLLFEQAEALRLEAEALDAEVAELRTQAESAVTDETLEAQIAALTAENEVLKANAVSSEEALTAANVTISSLNADNEALAAQVAALTAENEALKEKAPFDEPDNTIKIQLEQSDDETNGVSVDGAKTRLITAFEALIRERPESVLPLSIREAVNALMNRITELNGANDSPGISADDEASGTENAPLDEMPSDGETYEASDAAADSEVDGLFDDTDENESLRLVP